jgi:hypothetical protein
MRILSSIYSLFLSALSKLFFLLQLFLFLRLLLKFLGASPEALAVDIIYRNSDTLVSPFNFIFNDLFWQGRLIEISVVSAMAGYAVAFFVLIRILRLFQRG